jgi:nucleoside-diphosphate-sugar epimerase
MFGFEIELSEKQVGLAKKIAKRLIQKTDEEQIQDEEAIFHFACLFVTMMSAKSEIWLDENVESVEKLYEQYMKDQNQWLN